MLRTSEQFQEEPQLFGDLHHPPVGFSASWLFVRSTLLHISTIIAFLCFFICLYITLYIVYIYTYFLQAFQPELQHMGPPPPELAGFLEVLQKIA